MELTYNYKLKLLILFWLYSFVDGTRNKTIKVDSYLDLDEHRSKKFSFYDDSLDSNDGNVIINLEPIISEPGPITVYMKEANVLHFNYFVFTDIESRVPLTGRLNYSMLVSIDDEDKVVLSNTSNVVFINKRSGQFSLALKGKLPGRAKLYFKLRNYDKKNSFQLYIELKTRTIDAIFTAVVILLVVLANIGMGAKVDLKVVKAELRRPIAPIIGMCSQFIIMPLVAFAFAYNLDLDPGVALGFFALGCSPGGSASNAYTYLLKGNISLSVTMTLISTLASLGFLPLWLFTLGRLIYDQGNISIPYSNVFFSLLGLLVPLGVGLILQHKFPRVAEYFIKAVKYIVIIFFIFVLTVGIYANSFIFLLISWQVVLASACLPYIGFLFGGILATILGQPLANVIAIAVETGIQNTGIPIILLRLSLSGPDKDTGIVTPVVSAIFTPMPLMVAIAYIQIKAWRKRKQQSARCDSMAEELNSLPDSEREE